MIKYKKIGDNSEDIIDVVLNNRGITREQALEIIYPSIEQYNPTTMKNMDKGIQSLENAINDKMKIGIVADVDADGYTSAAIMNDFITNELNYKNIELVFHINSVKSHGVDKEIFNSIINKNIQYLIIPDAGSGIDDYENLKILKDKYNISSLILDHHDVEHPNEFEGIILINPKQSGDIYLNKHLSGCGVTYKFIKAFSEGIVDIGNKYIDSVALSLVSDMCNLKDSLENRLLLNIGSLKENITSPLLEEFIVSKGITGDKITIENYAFIIGSQINATIRCGSQEDKEMLLESFYNKKSVQSNKKGGFGALEDIHVEILRRMTNNKNKQDRPIKIASEKMTEYIKENNLINDKVIMLNVTDLLDNSVTGLVANKMIREFKRPILLYRDKKDNDDLVGGSARGYKLESFKDICSETGLFNFCSGHKNAWGYEIKKDRLDMLKNALNDKLKDFVLEDVIEVDAAFNVSPDIQEIKDIASLSDLWCNDIQEPKFLIKNIELDASKIMKIGNATYTWKNEYGVTFTKNFGSRVWIEEFTHQSMIDNKARYPFESKNIICDIVCKFRKNDKGYAFLEVVDTKSKIIQ